MPSRLPCAWVAGGPFIRHLCDGQETLADTRMHAGGQDSPTCAQGHSVHLWAYVLVHRATFCEGGQGAWGVVVFMCVVCCDELHACVSGYPGPAPVPTRPLMLLTPPV